MKRSGTDFFFGLVDDAQVAGKSGPHRVKSLSTAANGLLNPLMADCRALESISKDLKHKKYQKWNNEHRDKYLEVHIVNCFDLLDLNWGFYCRFSF